ncbi:MAG: hypothetical protein HOB42_03145 [Candidatus Marinimicrobia bacterium]|jgi:hypothetical protein|nr:hypothetical protein [Candidatus Neomarinimicrobiota bacterium]
MALQIKPKRTSSAGNAPTTSNLEAGEIAINLADKKLYVRDTSNNILELTTRSLNALDNVSVASPSDGQVLKYNAATSIWEAQEDTAKTNLTSLTDITINTPEADHVLQYNGTSWVNATLTTTTNPLNAWATQLSYDYTLPSYFLAEQSGPWQINSGATLTISENSTVYIHDPWFVLHE